MLEDSLSPYISLEKINSVFEGMLGQTLSKQIPILQQQVVAHAKCIIMVGGGNFQESV